MAEEGEDPELRELAAQAHERIEALEEEIASRWSRRIRTTTRA